MNEYLNVTDAIFKYKGKPFGCLQDLKIKISRATKNITCQASGAWAEAIAGQASWTASASGVQRLFTAADVEDEVTQDEIFDALVAGEVIEIEYSYAKAGFVGARYTGKALITSQEWSRPATDEVTWAVELTGNGPLTRVGA